MIKNLPLQERPRERLTRYGADALSAIELIAILLSSGTKGRSAIQLATDLLAHFGTLQRLSEASVAELAALHGVGQAKAIRLKAAFALASRAQANDSPQITLGDPDEIAAWIRLDFQSQKSESLMVLLANIKRQIFHREIVAVGTLTEVLLHPREIFFPAIRHKAHTILIAHNHPSGDPTPSKQDIEMTRAIREAGRTLGIELIDHIILGRDTCYSFREKGMFC